MNILKNLFLFNKKSEKNKEFSPGLVDQSLEIAKLVKEARIQQNLTIKELSYISKIPERIINSIENNNKSTKPEYPFIRSILIKLEECLVLKKNTLLKLAVREKKFFKKGEKYFLFRKFDLINTWQGSLLYFFILVLTIFILKRYFIVNVKFIEIQNIENQIIDK
jgi:cytoskeletal protein RodZ